MSEPFIGEIKLVAFNFPPRGWAFCAGQILAINQNQALFSLLGTTFGGDGVRTFALPDLRSRIALGLDQGPGLSPYTWGQKGGAETIALTGNQLPAHTHDVRVNSGAGTTSSPVNAYPAMSPDSVGKVYRQTGTFTTMPNETIATIGDGQYHENRQPALVLNYIIAIFGIFPSRS